MRDDAKRRDAFWRWNAAGLARLAAQAIALGLVASRPAAATTIVVPADQPTISQAVLVALPGDTIRIAPGSYNESVRIRGAKAGLTIEAADPADPPTIVGTPNKSNDGFRVDKVDGVTLRNLRIVGAYDGVRLNAATNARLHDLYLESNALGIRVQRGHDNAIERCTIAGSRVEEGVYVTGSPAIVLSDVVTDATYAAGVRVNGSPGARLERVRASGTRRSEGIKVYRSPSARIEDCVASGNARDGIRVHLSQGLALARNAAVANGNAGLWIERCIPFVSESDVIASGNSATGNLLADIVVIRPPCAPACVSTTTSPPPVTTTSTPAPPTTTTLIPAQATWRLYVKIATTTGGTRSVDVPLRSTDAPVPAAIADDQIAAFPLGDQVTGTEIAALGGDALARLVAAATSYVATHPADYPDAVGVVELRWALREA